MNEYMNERDAWLLLAVHIEALGMPLHIDGFRMTGLCACVHHLYKDGLVSYSTYRNMHRRISRALNRRRNYVYLAPRGAAKPRVKWCLKFAKECR